MRKVISLIVFILILLNNFGTLYAYKSTITNTPPISNFQIDILKDGITANNAGLILQEKTFTTGNLDISNLKFTITNGAKLSLDSNIKKSFEVATKTRSNYNLAKNNSSFKAISKIEDKIIEYPDRVRIIAKTEYSYNNKAEYDAIFSGTTDTQIISSKQVSDFIAKNPDYNKYSSGIPKANKKDILEKLTEKVYDECLSKNRNNVAICKKTTIKNNVENHLNNYKGKRILTETIDVNKIPLIYDADKNIDFVERLKNSNISKNPNEVRLSSLQIRNAFAQYTQLSLTGGLNNLSSNQSPSTKTCEGLNGNYKINCEKELAKVNANNAGTNASIVNSGTLLNGFTLGESYSYTLADSYSILGFTVYDIGVSFYAGYGVGIRIPIDYTISTNKDRLEKGQNTDYTTILKVDTADKDKNWFIGALGENKAFDGKEAVLEAGAYAKGWIVLFEQTVFNEQIGGKADWGSNQKIPFGNNEKLKVFSGEVEGNEIGLEVMLYGVHISGDLKAEGYITGDISYECRTLSSQGISGTSLNCKDLDNTSLKDKDIPDITINPTTKTSILNFKGETDKYYYKNDLGIYSKFGVELQRFKYEPKLNIDLSLRGKVGVDTGDYFGRFWLKTPWLKVYSFDIDLPTLGAHSGYSQKSIKTYENSYLYNFTVQNQDIPEGFDDSTKNELYSINNETGYNTINGFTSNTNTGNLAPFLYGGKIFPNSLQKPVYQTNINNGYYTIITQDDTKKYHGYIRDHGEGNNFLTDYIRWKKAAEIQHVTNNVGSQNNNVIFYYSNATNAIWGANLGGGISDVKNLDNKILNDTKIISLPGTNCSDYAGAVKDRGEDCPVANDFNYFGGMDGYNNLVDKTGMTFPYKKFNFAFHPQFNQSNKNLFAYIAKTNNRDINKVKIYNNGNWGEIEDSMLGEPTYIQINQDNSLIVIYKEFNNSTNKYSYKIQKYSFKNSWESQRLYVKNIEGIDNITDFYYDDNNKTVFVSALEKNTTGVYNGVVYAIRYNGINNTPFKQKIYTSSISHEDFTSYYLEQKTYQDWKQTKITSAGTNPINTAISSINFDLDNKTFYINGYANNGANSLQYIKKINYSLYPVVIGEDIENYSEDGNNSGNPSVAPSTMNIGPNTNNSTSNLFSRDEYINEKLKEINNCFIESYSGQLDNINTAIENLQKELEKQTDENARAKYTRAIAKMEEIKNLFMERYKTIIDLNK